MDFALQVLETIILASIVILAVWLINRAIGSKAGYRWRKILWLILAVRLIFPIPLNITDYLASFQQFEVNIPLPDSASHAAVSSDMLVPSEGTNAQTGTVLPDADATLNETVQTGNTVNNAVTNENTDLSQNTVTNATTDLAVNTASVMSKNTILTFVLVIWAVGALVSIGIRVFQYHWLKSKYLHKALLCEDASIIAMMNIICNEFGIQKPLRIMVQNNITSPMLFGYFNTILFLPEIPYSEAELNSVLRHELTHYKHRDLWYKLLMMFTCDLYWFNPIFRLMKRMAYKDVECICDEKATKHMSLEDKRTYCNSILKTMTGVRDKNLAFTTQFAANKKTAKQRLENILTSPNRKAGIAILCVLLMAMIMGTACVSFNIASEDETEDTVEETLEADETEKSTEESTDAAETEPATPEFSGMTIDADLTISDDVLNNLKTMHPDLEISVVDFDDEQYYDALYDKREDEAGTPPTIVYSYTDTVIDLGKAGIFADITDNLKERGWIDAMTDSVKGHVSDENGRFYGVPDLFPYSFGIVCNVEMFEAAGLVDEEGCPLMPETWEELAETAVKIKEATGEAGFSFQTDFLGSVYWANIAWCFGATDLCIDNGDETYTANLASDEAIAAMEYIKALKWDYDVLLESPINVDYDTNFEYIGTGKVAMCIGANDAIHYPTTYGLSPDKVALGAMPAGPSGLRYSISDTGVYAISADATQEEINAALDLLEINGKGPVLNDATKSNIESIISDRVSTGNLAIGEIPIWKNTEIKEYEQSILAQYCNTNQALYQSYFDAISSPDYALRNILDTIQWPATGFLPAMEEVLIEVLSNPDADVPALMQDANEFYQDTLDRLEYDNAF